MPLMVTFFNVRKGRDAIFKRGMRHFFPRTARRYQEQYGISSSAGSTSPRGPSGTT